MPKRKRGAYDGGGDRTISKQKRDVEERLTEGRKSLQKALKAAKGFERQRLGKRLTNARSQGKEGEIERINKEIQILKGLDLPKVGEAHLRKTILKVKAFAESELLPEATKAEPEKPDMTEEDLKAWNNVLSGMFNMKPLKESMGHIMTGLYTAFGVSAPNGKQTGGEKKALGKETSKDSLQPADTQPDSGDEDMEDVLEWEGFSGDDDQESDLEAEDDEMAAGSDEDLDEEELARYDALLGASSDEESFDEEEYKLNHPSEQTTERLSLSLSPAPSVQFESEAESELESESESEAASPPPKKVAKTTKAKPVPAKVGGSTFLPTLMGGYYEGSESSASDIEEEVTKKPAKKNRPGQMARQAIWEKKYGKGANHMKQGLGPVGERKGRDDGWDAKRGAKDGDRRGRGGGSNRGRGRPVRATGENSTAIGERKKPAEKKEDAGVLHPSWQAAKKAKEATKTANFQGKKVVFD